MNEASERTIDVIWAPLLIRRHWEGEAPAELEAVDALAQFHGLAGAAASQKVR